MQLSTLLRKVVLNRPTLFHFYNDILAFWFTPLDSFFLTMQNHFIYVSYLTSYLWLAFTQFNFSGCVLQGMCVPGHTCTGWRGATTSIPWGPKGSSHSWGKVQDLAWQPECSAGVLHPPILAQWQFTVSKWGGCRGLEAELPKLFITNLVPNQKYWLSVM